MSTYADCEKFLESVDLDDHEVPLAEEAKRLCRRLDAIDAALEGVADLASVPGTRLLREERQYALALERLVRALAPSTPQDRSVQARKAALARWRGVA